MMLEAILLLQRTITHLLATIPLSWKLSLAYLTELTLFRGPQLDLTEYLCIVLYTVLGICFLPRPRLSRIV
jgi:hypothetical protein